MLQRTLSAVRRLEKSSLSKTQVSVLRVLRGARHKPERQDVIVIDEFLSPGQDDGQSGTPDHRRRPSGQDGGGLQRYVRRENRRGRESGRRWQTARSVGHFARTGEADQNRKWSFSFFQIPGSLQSGHMNSVPLFGEEPLGHLALNDCSIN